VKQYTVTDIEIVRDAWNERREGEVVGSYETLNLARENAQHLQSVYFTDGTPEHSHLIIINDTATRELVDEYVVSGKSALE